MLTTLRHNSKPSRFILYPLVVILSFLLCLPWVIAKEPPKPKPQDWQINGIVAALNDGYPEVKKMAWAKLAEYELKNLKTVVKNPDDLAQKAANIFKDKTADSNVSSVAADTLRNLGEVANPYVKNIVDILKDKTVDAGVRSSAASTLGDLGEAAKRYVQDIADILKDKTDDSGVRSSATSALGKLGETSNLYVPVIADVLKDKTDNANVRYSAGEALGNLGEAAKPYIQNITDILKDKTDNYGVRNSAIQALGNLGEAGKPYIQNITEILKDKTLDANVRVIAAEALGKLGETSNLYVPVIADIFKDKTVDGNVRSRAAVALGNMGEAAKPYIKDILDFLKDKTPNSYNRGIAAEALGNLGKTGNPYVKDIADFLKDETVDTYIRQSVASALGKLGEVASPYVKDILDYLKDEKVNPYFRGDAASALVKLGEAAKPYFQYILNFLKDEKVDSFVRSRTGTFEFYSLGEAGKPYVKDILDFLKDKNVDSLVRGNVANILVFGKLGEATKPYVQDIANILKDKTIDANIRSYAVVALGNLGETAKPYAQDILDFLKDKTVSSSSRLNAAEALGKIEQLNLNNVVAVLDNVYYIGNDSFSEKIENWRFVTYLLSGGTAEVKTLLTWLGKPQAIPAQLTHDEGVRTLQVFLKAWEPTQGLEALRGDLAKQIAVVARKVPWQPQDVTLLENHYNNLKKGGYNEADSLQSVIVTLKGQQRFSLVRNIILIHIALWVVLIFAYPKSPQVQAIFFWNPWVRRILGLGYIGFLLTWVPFLRRKLFEPFKTSLLADARLDNFNLQAYFPDSRVKVPGTGELLAITKAIPNIKGQIVLEGDSGSGKSMFLRYLVKTSQQILVYLPAQKCDKSVIKAIQVKLPKYVQDTNFLKNLIYSGALDIYIDGLNEVTADTRAKITQFAESNFRGNIIMTTQPLEWIHPSTAKIYYLQSLEQEQIKQFLMSHQSQHPKDAQFQGIDFEQVCTHYLAQTLNDQQSPEELAAAERILSNPMDLTLVALMLSQGEKPDLFHLQQQQYNLMSAEYLQKWKQEFPLKRFSQAVYQMRLNDEQALPADEFYQESMSLEDEKYKMVVSRRWQDEKGEPKQEWYFSHDKVMEFFIVQNFLGASNEAKRCLIDHMGDSRFRGVYFLLATLLPLDAAKELREKLIQYAADTKDHNVSDTFVQLLRFR